MTEEVIVWRKLEPGQVSRLRVYDTTTGTSSVVYETDSGVFEAPNWTTDGQWLVINQDGELYKVSPSGGEAILIDKGDIHIANNDHVLDPDGEHIFVSEQDGHIYRVPLAGGSNVRVTDPDDGLDARYLHGVSPDGKTLVFIGGPVTATLAPYNIYAFDLDSGAITQLTFSEKRHDGAEYSPDGQWVYFNSERESTIPGHCQLFRMRPDGSEVEQLTFDDRVNWFPHPSPDGTKMAYLSYPPLTDGHPANLPVQIIVTDLETGTVIDRIELFGGQGTINVPSWSPDSTKFGYAEYPIG